jgi:rhodanese-related sulfurtransferase
MPQPIPKVSSTGDSANVPIEVDVQTVSHWKANTSDWVLIDCREQQEYDVASIDGAILLPMSQWQEVSSKLDTLRDKHLVVHCHHGGRSMRVANWLRSNGFPTAQSMAGGIDLWSQTIDDSIARY